jgi:hypothetical protein
MRTRFIFDGLPRGRKVCLRREDLTLLSQRDAVSQGIEKLFYGHFANSPSYAVAGQDARRDANCDCRPWCVGNGQRPFSRIDPGRREPKCSSLPAAAQLGWYPRFPGRHVELPMGMLARRNSMPNSPGKPLRHHASALTRSAKLRLSRPDESL